MIINEPNAQRRANGFDHKETRWGGVRRDAKQFAVIAVAVALLVLLAYALKEEPTQNILALETFTSGNLGGSGFVTGVLNTVKVVVLAIAFSTILGALLGVSRLSTNWVLRNLSFGIVELVRNTPLLIQLFVWYFAVVLLFPPLVSAGELYGGLIVSQQGVFLPALSWSGDDSAFLIGLTTAAWIAVAGAVFDPVRGMRRACMVASVVLIGALFASGMVSVD